VTALAISIRTTHLGALALLVGSFAFLLLVARPAFRGRGPESAADFERFDRLLLRLAWWSLLIALVSGFAWLWAQTAIVTGRPLGQALTPDAVGKVLTRTQFGQVWQLRLGLAVVLGAFLLLREREEDGRDWMALRFEGVTLAVGMTTALSWAGHAAATAGRARLAHLVADSIHLFAVGVWLGGLLPLALLLSRARRSPDPSWVAVAREATRRFSALALASVACLILTGAVNSWFLVGGVPTLVGTPYGRLLLLKLSLLIPLIAIAAQNLLRLKPQLSAAPVARVGEALGNPLRRLRRNVIAEASLGVAILLVVGALGITPPALHVQPSWPFPFRLRWEAANGIPRAQLVDAYPTTYLRPAVPYSALSVAKGLHLYRQHCAVCHGEAGYGDGPAAAGLPKKPADLTAKHTGDHTAGDLFWWLTHGIKGSPMPGFGDRLSGEERWDLINFLRALSAAEQARPMGPLVEPTPWLVAPDFTFGTGVGLGETLKDNRGWAMVHLVLFTLPGSLPRLEEIDRAWEEIGLAGSRVLAVPMKDAAQIYRKLGAHVLNFPIAVDGNEEIVETYAVFRRTLESEGVPPVPLHMEFLIDRQGYVRARWIPGQSRGWAEIPRLLREVERLDKETPSAPAPEEHVH
jgi:putative copper resistance protein D